MAQRGYSKNNLRGASETQHEQSFTQASNDGGGLHAVPSCSAGWLCCHPPGGVSTDGLGATLSLTD